MMDVIISKKFEFRRAFYLFLLCGGISLGYVFTVNSLIPAL